MMLDLLVGFSILCQGDVLPYTPEEEPPMAYFDVVPQQDVTGVFNMGAVAYHLEGMDRVEYTITRQGYVGDWNRDDIVDGEDLAVLIERWGQGVGGREIAHLLGAWGQQIPHEPEVVTVTEMTLNPRTGELEYWFALDTRKHPDTKITVTAEAFGSMGPSTVLDRDIWDESFPRPQYNGVNLFSTNVGNYWPTRKLYISPNGNDQTGDGTRKNPLKGVHAALRYGLQQPYAEIGGTTVYLLEGEHTLDSSGGWPTNSFRQSNGRYFTITPAPGVAPADCKIVASESITAGGGFMTKGLCRFKNVHVDTDQENILNGGTKFGGGRWYDNSIIEGKNYTVDNEPMFVTGKGGFQWWTDSIQTWTQEGTTGLLMRNHIIDGAACDAIELHYAQMILSTEITNHNPEFDDTNGCHIDYMQYNAIDFVYQNVILRDIYGNHTCRQQGVHACPGEGDGGAIHNSAWINVQLSNQGGNGIPECSPVALIWRWCGLARNNLFKDCILVQKQSNIGDRHSTWSYTRNHPDGSRNEEGPWTWSEDDQEWRFINVKVEDCFEDWEKTQPLFPAPSAGQSWTFYGPNELMWDSNMNDGIQENPFGPDDPWFCEITGVYYTQTD